MKKEAHGMKKEAREMKKEAHGMKKEAREMKKEKGDFPFPKRQF